MNQLSGVWPVLFQLTEAKTGFNTVVLDQKCLLIGSRRDQGMPKDDVKPRFFIFDMAGNISPIDKIPGTVFGGFITSKEKPDPDLIKIKEREFLANKHKELNEILEALKNADKFS